jgi:hypothetical protein
MTREELIELAALDAFGLLDEYETALYTRSFHHAPAAVQDELRQLQAAVASDTTLLPDIEPSKPLRSRVLEAVSRAIEAESAELAPLAMIGRSRAERREIIGRIGLGATGQVWRAAAFVLAGVLLVVLYFGRQGAEPNEQLMGLAVDLLAQEQVRAHLAEEEQDDIVGPDLMEFLNDPTCKRFVLRPDDENVDAIGIIFVNEDTNQAFLLTLGLPTDGSYSIAASDSEGVFARKSFSPRSGITGLQLGEVPALALSEISVIISNTAGEIVLRI